MFDFFCSLLCEEICHLIIFNNMLIQVWVLLVLTEMRRCCY